MNAGKAMERQWRKSVLRLNDVYYQRMNDGTATFYGGQSQNGIRFQKTSPYDCFMYSYPMLFLIELKSHKGKSLPYTAIRRQQVESTAKAGWIPGVVAGFVVHFTEVGECWFAPGWKVKDYMDKSDRKSIPLEWFQSNGARIGVIMKRTNAEYDVEQFLIDCGAERNKGDAADE